MKERKAGWVDAFGFRKGRENEGMTHRRRVIERDGG